MVNDCIFCKIARKEISAEVIYESKNFIAFPDKNPCTKGHTLIIPKKHFVNLIEMPESLGGELLEAIKKVAARGFEEGAEGFNVFVNTGEAAGQIVMHLHIHVVPRKKGQAVKFRF